MTMERIAEGLQLLVLQLANRKPTDTPPTDDWTLAEWVYVCGLASGAIMQHRDRLLTALTQRS